MGAPVVILSAVEPTTIRGWMRRPRAISALERGGFKGRLLNEGVRAPALARSYLGPCAPVRSLLRGPFGIAVEIERESKGPWPLGTPLAALPVLRRRVRRA